MPTKPQAKATTGPSTNISNATVSVVIPAYNAGEHLAATLRSVFAQSVQPHEVIVVDDGSSDDTAAVAKSFPTRVIASGHRGLSAVRNIGTRAATGEYIAYLDADDLWAPHKLAVQLAALTSLPYPAFSFTDYRNFDESGVQAATSGLRRHPAFAQVVGKARGRSRIVIAVDDRRPVLPDMYFLPSSTLIRRADVLAIGGFDETLPKCEDYEFFLRLFRIVPAVAVMEPLLLYRRHSKQMSAGTVAMSAGLFDVERRVIAATERYPAADARYIATKAFLIHYRLGIAMARCGKFDDAVQNFEKSMRERPTAKAACALVAAHICRSAPGRYVFDMARTFRQKRARRSNLVF